MLPIVSFQIERAAFRKLIDCRNNVNKTEEIITTSIMYVIIKCILFVLIFLLIGLFVDNNYKIFLLINVIAYILLSLLQQIARGIDRINDYTISSFLSAFFTIVFNLIFILVLDLKAYGMLLGTFLGQFIAFIYLLFITKIYKYIKIKKFKKNVLSIMLKYSIPLIPNSLAWWVFNASDRVIVTGLLGVGQNGIYAAAIKFSTIITILYNIFDTTWVESVSSNIDDKGFDDYFNKTFNVMIKFFIGLGLTLIASMPIVYPLMVNEKFGTGYVLVPISILASMFNVLQGLVSVVYLAKMDTKSVAKTSIIAAIVNAVVHLSLIKLLGLYASVFSTFIAFFILGIYRFVDVNKKYVKIDLDKKTIYSFLIVLICMLFIYYMDNMLLSLMMLLIVIVYSFILNYKSFDSFIRMIFKNKKRNKDSIDIENREVHIDL